MPSVCHPIVPEPYYGGANGFEHVLDLIEDACNGLLQHIRPQSLLQVRKWK